jgi:hypothetical protein
MHAGRKQESKDESGKLARWKCAYGGQTINALFLRPHPRAPEMLLAQRSIKQPMIRRRSFQEYVYIPLD